MNQDVRLTSLRSRLRTAGIDPARLEPTLKQLIAEKNLKWQMEDAAWRLFNHRIIEATCNKDYLGVQRVYSVMAELEKERGRSFSGWWRNAKKAELQYLASQGVRKVRVVTNCECNACRGLKDLTWNIEEAIRLLPYPQDCPGQTPLSGGYESC